jgi:hypothetical protein
MTLDEVHSFLQKWSDLWVLATAVGTIAMAYATLRVIK